MGWMAGNRKENRNMDCLPVAGRKEQHVLGRGGKRVEGVIRFFLEPRVGSKLFRGRQLKWGTDIKDERLLETAEALLVFTLIRCPVL